MLDREKHSTTGRSQTLLFLTARSSFKDMLVRIVLIPSVRFVCCTEFEFESLGRSSAHGRTEHLGRLPPSFTTI